MTPRYAGPHSTIHVYGTVTNNTNQSVDGLQVQIYGGPDAFGNPSQMSAYAAGTADGAFVGRPVGDAQLFSGTLRPGGTLHWSASFTSTEAGLSSFGVYPIEAGLLSAGGAPLDAQRSFLPFWPGRTAAKPLKISWVWPLVDMPRQGPCADAVTSASLGASLAGDGRLSTLLGTGLQYAQATKLTWAVDPALLSDAALLGTEHRLNNGSNCSAGSQVAANPAATQWVSKLRNGAAGEPMFLTSYADVDVAALSHAGLNSDLAAAYALGKSVAGKILPGAFLPIGWPASGVADAGVLTSLGKYGDLNTVIMDSNQMPPAGGSFTDDAVASLTTGLGSKMHVLLADHKLSSVLAAASQPGAGFAAEQEFLAETAMIVAESPFKARSVVVVPPRRWNPSASVAGELLRETTDAPWLRPAQLSSLASSRPVEAHRQPPGNHVSHSELSPSYMALVKQLHTNLTLYQSLLDQPGAAYLSRMQAAVAVTESSALRGNNAAAGKTVRRLGNYLSRNQRALQIVLGAKVTLAGTSGYVPISVYNGLPQTVQVRVVATTAGNRLKIGDYKTLITVGGKTTYTLKVPVSSAALGTTDVQLQLVTKDGSLLAWTAKSLSVESTRYGRTLMVLIGAALGVLVLTSVMRWTRRWLADGKAGGTG